ncbi:MAG: ABC transporter ATP-binding protein [Chloroflexi bacterium]|nr:ABC transporter ATP-binding protein [Chloroflexota bacterium]
MSLQTTTDPHQPEADSVLVEMRGIWKHFPGVVANQGIDLELRAGEVHALLGENGAGKSTLMNILAGTYHPDGGAILIRGQPVQFKSPAQAIAAGVGMVHQHFRLVETLSVAENIHLGWNQTPWGVSAAILVRRTEAICAKFGLYVDPHAKIWQLSTGEQQRVEILRVLARGAHILILDEPTAVLTPQESAELFQVMRALVAAGQTIVFISHKLDEVLGVSDRITILRGGRKVATRWAAECDHRLLARLMVGQEVASRQYQREPIQGKTMLELCHIHILNDRGLPALVDINLTIREGEILGVAGVAGNGQKELAEVLTGLRPLRQGSIILDGTDLTGASAARIASAGVGHIPEDRIKTGMIRSATVTHNAILREYKQSPISRGIRLINQEATKFAQALVKQADVRVPHVRIPMRHLSGGNQQRLVARREARMATRLLVAASPTRGLDIGATEEVQRFLIAHRNAGGAVLLISEDLDEVMNVSDRIVVMYEGRLLGEFEAATANREEIGLLMGGKTTAAEDNA